MGDSLFSLATTGDCGMDNPLNRPILNVPGLLKLHGIEPNKRLGQNFLIDPVYLSRVVDASDITEKDTVLEIGAGVGNLTSFLGAQAKQVIAVEIDSALIPILTEVTGKYPNIKIIEGDIFGYELLDLVTSKIYYVVANIPYYITSKLIRHLMTSVAKPERVILTIQKEVAERICAPAGKLSLLGLSVQVFGHPDIKSKIPAGAFYPSPKVDSAIVRIDMYPSPRIPAEYLEPFFHLAKAGFSQKRKNLRNSLSAGTNLDKKSIEELLGSVGIDPRRRAETLSIEEWQSVTLEYMNLVSPKKS